LHMEYRLHRSRTFFSPLHMEYRLHRSRTLCKCLNSFVFLLSCWFFFKIEEKSKKIKMKHINYTFILFFINFFKL
jgi:hypothetical protein